MGSYRSQIRGWETLALVAVLIAAIAFRTWHLNRVPPGLTHDEASNGHDAAAILRGTRPIYFTVGYGHEPLYPYSVALSMALLRTDDLTLRLTTVAWGVGLILSAYLLARSLFGSFPALITAAWMAVSFWCVMTSRIGLRAITSATTFTASTYAFWRASSGSGTASRRRGPDAGLRLRTGSWLWWCVSGAFLGASIYTYMASRVLPAVYIFFLAYLIALHGFGRQQETESPSKSGQGGSVWATNLSTEWKRQLVGVAILLLVASILAAPLVHFLMTHPQAEQRLQQLSGPIRDALGGRFGDLWGHVFRSLPTFTIRGDPLWLYNIPGRPLLDAASGAFFYAGLVVCLWRWRRPRYVFLLLWLVVGVGPALVTGPDAVTLRSITAQPAIFIIAALGLTTIVRYIYRRGEWLGRVTTATAVATLLLATGVRTAQAYFGVWAQHRNVRVAYHHALVEQAHYLDAQTEAGPVAFSSIYPGRFHDPYTMEVALHRDDLSLRWFDGRYSLVFPAEGESRVLIPSIASLDEALLPLFTPHAARIHTERFRSDDLITRFDVYDFDADDALAAFMPALGKNPVFWSPLDTFLADGPQSTYEPLELPVNAGDVVDLLGYDLQTPVVEPGGDITLLTLWRVRDTVVPAQPGSLTSELVAFTHALAPDGRVVGQMDRLDVPSWHWQAGDAFVQIHRFPLNVDLTPGHYGLEVGFYTREESERVPIMAGDTAIDDRILLRPLEVIAP